METGKDYKDYEKYLRTEELAEGTIRIYLREAKKLNRYLSGKEITKDSMLEYKELLVQEGNSPSTTNLHITAVNRYMGYLDRTDCVLKTLRLQTRHSIGQMITVEEYRVLLDYAKASGRKKYYLILRTLAMTGIRISELRFFTVEILEKKVITVTSKQKTREICIPENLLKELKFYCKEQGIEQGVIFRGEDDRPISRIAVYKMLVKMADMTGMEKGKVHPHSLRHLFAVTYMEHYANLFELADLLGHSSLETTRIYARSTTEKKRQRIGELGL